MQITFIEGHKRLCKAYSEEGVQAYPLVRTVTSHAYFIPKTMDGLREKLRLLRKHALDGHAMLKGPLSRKLNKESRAGATDTDALTENIIIDIDGVVFPGHIINKPITQEAAQTLAERVIRELPEYFHNVSYIAHASSSLGMKGDKVSIHLDFALATSIMPIALKRWLTHINFSVPFFTDQLSLTATGHALKYPIDISLADNSRIIYIAPPLFDKVTDPFPDTETRLFMVEKDLVSIEPPEDVLKIRHEHLLRRSKDLITSIREMRGLPKRFATTTSWRIDDRNVDVVVNPDKISLQMAYEKDKYVYYNINDGDSNAYYVYKNKPQVVWNFKGEPPFLFEQADPTTYAEHIKRYIQCDGEIAANFAPEPVGFCDATTDRYYRGLVNRATGELIRIHKTHRQGVFDWMVEHNGIEMENIPTWDYRFDPTDPRSVDVAQKFINQFTPSELMKRPEPIDEKYIGLDYNNSYLIAEACPNIFKILVSVTGNGEDELKHLINWLAHVISKRERAETAWVLHGTEGTGKGVLFDKILRPIIGHRHATQVRLENIDDQFNDYMERSVLLMVDEFRFSSSKNHQALLEKLRNYITEPELSIRGMRENMRVAHNYCSIILCGNDRDMMRPSDGDRRYNIGQRQERKLFEQFPELKGNLHLVEAEVPIFASIMLNFKVDADAVREPLQNEAKEQMRAAARTSSEDFIKAIQSADLEYFIDVLDMVDPSLDNYLHHAKNAVRAMLDNYNTLEGTPVSTQQLLFCYQAIIGDTRLSAAKFAKMLARYGIDMSQRFYVNQLRMRGTRINFNVPNIEELRKTFITTRNVAPLPEARIA